MAQASIRIQGNQLGWRFLIMYNHGKLREEQKYRKRESKEDSHLHQVDIVVEHDCLIKSFT